MHGPVDNDEVNPREKTKNQKKQTHIKSPITYSQKTCQQLRHQRRLPPSHQGTLLTSLVHQWIFAFTIETRKFHCHPFLFCHHVEFFAYRSCFPYDSDFTQEVLFLDTRETYLDNTATSYWSESKDWEPRLTPNSIWERELHIWLEQRVATSKDQSHTKEERLFGERLSSLTVPLELWRQSSTPTCQQLLLVDPSEFSCTHPVFKSI